MNNQYLDAALEAVNKASDLLSHGFAQSIETKYKNSGVAADVVTKYDFQSQQIIVDQIKKYFPDHNILSEEGVEENNGSKFRWIIDPLDGTTNFSRGIPNFSISVALEENKNLILGIIALPAQNEIYWASLGEGAFMNSKKIKVSDKKDLKSSVIGVAMLRSAEALDLGSVTFNKLAHYPAKVRVFGSVATDLARVASGKMDGIAVNHNKPWDIAAGIILIQEAGGKVSAINEELSLEAKQIVASNPYIHSELVNYLKK